MRAENASAHAATEMKKIRAQYKAEASQPVEALLMLQSAFATHSINFDRFLNKQIASTDPMTFVLETARELDLFKLDVLLMLADREGSQTHGLF